jgi:hypothetical protein
MDGFAKICKERARDTVLKGHTAGDLIVCNSYSSKICHLRRFDIEGLYALFEFECSIQMLSVSADGKSR